MCPCIGPNRFPTGVSVWVVAMVGTWASCTGAISVQFAEPKVVGGKSRYVLFERALRVIWTTFFGRLSCIVTLAVIMPTGFVGTAAEAH